MNYVIDKQAADRKEDAGGERKIASRANAFFFMHIAKTAGSFVNNVLQKGLGPRFVEHCEAQGRLTSNDIAVWSGHIYLPQWRAIEKLNAWKMKRFTLLRDPVAQTASHILWLDHYALPEFQREYKRLDPGSRKVVDEIRDTDLSDAGEIDRFLTQIIGRGVQYFDNCQSRYFLAGSGGVRSEDFLHLGLRSQLCAAMKDFAVIGVGERMEHFIARVSEEIAVPLVCHDERINESKSARQIDLGNSDIRMVISKRVMLDAWLYQAVSDGSRP